MGGLNVIRFLPDGEIRVEPVTLSPATIEELESRLLLFFTGTSRLSSEVAGDVIANLEKKQNVLRQMRSMVDESLTILNGKGCLDDFGKLLHKNWMLKRCVSDSICNSTIDKIYKIATDNGSLGGKLLGAGSSGFMVFYVPPEKQQNVKDALAGYLHVPFKFENEGSTIIYYSSKN